VCALTRATARSGLRRARMVPSRAERVKCEPTARVAEPGLSDPRAEYFTSRVPTRTMTRTSAAATTTARPRPALSASGAGVIRCRLPAGYALATDMHRAAEVRRDCG